MKISKVVKKGNGYFYIDTCQLTDPLVNMMDSMGFGNEDASAFEYETMVFSCDKDGKVEDWGELDKENYSTEEEARQGHKKMVKKWSNKK